MKAEELEKIVLDVLNGFEYEVMSEEYENVAEKIAASLLQQREEAERELIKFCLPNWVDSDRETIYNEFQDYKSKKG